MIGRVIAGKYRIIELIGRGGMAEVYKAAALAPPHKTVAVKLLKSEFQNDAAFVRRFESEANTVLSLSHDNIVRSHDVGRDGDAYYIVLEYVEGETLKQHIQKTGPLPLRTLVNIGAQVLDALTCAHERGIVHRDVKPQNIILNKRLKAKLADFGIARMSVSSDTVTYANNTLLGSVHYFSPEQAQGRAATAQSDIYSMGVTLYEMATGSVPFAGDNSVSIALKHLRQEPIPPAMLNPAVPPALSDIILKALNKKPTGRYNSARAMRQDLLRVLKEPCGDFAKPAQNGAPPPRKSKKRSRRTIIIIAAATFVLVAIFLMVMLMGQSILTRIRGEDTAALVPTLVGKTIDEATRLAELRGYTLKLAAEVVSQEHERGIIVEQLPIASTELPLGSAIQVTVSLGSGEVTYMPNLIGKTLAEAEILLSEVGLKVGEVDYRTNELPSGQVFKQIPEAETSMLHADEVTLYVSGAPARSLEAPGVLEQDLETALTLFTERGFTRFRVRRGETNELGGIVIRQQPSQGEMGGAGGIVTLTLTVSQAPEYRASLPFSMDVTQPETELMIVVEQMSGKIPYELVLYEDILTQGKQELNIELLFEEEGNRDIIVYIDAVESTRLPVAFRGQRAQARD